MKHTNNHCSDFKKIWISYKHPSACNDKVFHVTVLLKLMAKDKRRGFVRSNASISRSESSSCPKCLCMEANRGQKHHFRCSYFETRTPLFYLQETDFIVTGEEVHLSHDLEKLASCFLKITPSCKLLSHESKPCFGVSDELGLSWSQLMVESDIFSMKSLLVLFFSKRKHFIRAWLIYCWKPVF